MGVVRAMAAVGGVHWGHKGGGISDVCARWSPGPAVRSGCLRVEACVADESARRFASVQWTYGGGLPGIPYVVAGRARSAAEKHARRRLEKFHPANVGEEPTGGFRVAESYLSLDDVRDAAKLEGLPDGEVQLLVEHLGFEGCSTLTKPDLIELLGMVFETRTPPELANVWDAHGPDEAELFYLLNLGAPWKADTLLTHVYRDAALLHTATTTLKTLLPGRFLENSFVGYTPSDKRTLMCILTREPQAVLLGLYPEVLGRRLMDIQIACPTVDVREVWERHPEALAGTFLGETGPIDAEVVRGRDPPGTIRLEHVDALNALALHWRKHLPWEVMWDPPPTYASPSSKGQGHLQMFQSMGSRMGFY